MLHADAMPQLKPKRYYADVSQTHKDLTNDKYRNLRRPKKVTFFCNGDRFFKGKLLFITPHRYLSFQDLLGDLTGKLPTTSSLPYGVRQIYTPSGGRRIRDIEHLQDGKEYVCAGFESFKSLNYGTQALDPWSTGRPHKHTENNPSTLDLKGVSALPTSSSVHHGLTSKNNYDGYPQRRALRATNDVYSLRDDDRRYGTITKPKVITVVRAGRKPYPNIKILLNRRSVQSYERLLNDISESFGPKWKNNKVRSLYTLTGREIMSISDFFRGDSVFVAVGTEKISFTDVQDIIETLYPESPYAKSLLRNIERQKRKAKQEMLKSLANENQELQGKQGEQGKQGAESPSKRAGKNNNNSEVGKQESTVDQDDTSRKKVRPPKPSKRPSADSPRQEKENEPKPKLKEEEVEPLEELDKPKPKKKLSKRSSQIRPTETIPPIPQEKQTEVKQAEVKQTDVDENAPVVESEISPPKGETQANKETQLVKTKRQIKEEKQKELERAQQEKREAEAKAKAELYRELEHKVDKELAEKEKEESEKEPEKVEAGEKAEKTDKPEKIEEKEEVIEETKPKIRQAKSKEQRTVDKDEIGEKFDIGEILGDGNFAVVRSCRHIETGHEYAMKIIDKSKLRGKEHMIDNEIAIMKACDQENLVKLYDEFETREEIYIVMEYVKGGDLFDAIKTSVRFTEPVASKMCTDMTNALFYLHSRRIVHRDLKPENLMVMRNKDGSITLKLGDFGLAVEVKAPIYTICGTPTYVAPEILSEIGYGLEVDMWAVGIITYILLCGFPPFRATDNKQTELFEYIKAGEYEFLSPYWDPVSQEAMDLIRHLLVVEKKTRFTAVDVLCHPWIITVGGSKDTPADFKEYRANLRDEILEKGQQNLVEWRESRAFVFANSNHNTSTSQL